MCTISDTNVTTSIIVVVNGSSRKPSANWTSATCAHVYTLPLNALPARTSCQITYDATIEAATPRMHSQCDTLRPSLAPNRPTTIDAASGASGTRR